ncbi:CAP domain-containing protein [Sphingomonas sp. HF-S4]|uniref:CAP domain-containing protein n=1 Tax=Sphingomonas agrestis TaxID=3080540 RepID=A0ABU3Y4C2_9SPHN|nr:CAP domain-containing protein [Sphingomonas sp. HF-S4]MDV3456241.1 CAP domain-containing protein [Sphingomonas sp. HF-S4]
MHIVHLAIVGLAACVALPAAANDGTPRRRPLEAQVLERINHARQNPRAYAEELRDYRRYFDGDILYLPGDFNGIYTREGIAAVDEAIDFLERQAPLPALDHGDLLALAARDHAEDQGALGATGHVSRDGAGPSERVRRRGGNVFVGESISYGMADADAVVRQMVVDDGVPGRGHRTLLFQNNFRFAGVGCGGHRRYGHMCVVDLAGTIDGAPDLSRSASAATRAVPGQARAR